MKASIVIANYNNAKFINECIKSLNNQTYKNFEIIIFDDNSKDNSIEEMEKFKNIKIIKNKIQTKYGSLNQMNAFYKAIEISEGEIIFFLDSDDFFNEKKIEEVINVFLSNENKDIVFDYPILTYENNKQEKVLPKKTINKYWGYIHPTSCITVRKKFILDNYNKFSESIYTDIWIDFRILVYSKFVFNNYIILDKNLTYYRQSEVNISSKFKKYSKNWWVRRNAALNFLFDVAKKENIKIKKNLDYFLTKFFTMFFK